MIDRLNERAAAIARSAQRRTIARLVDSDLPPGITASASDDAVILQGEDLIRLSITDPRLRRFGR